MKPDWKKDRLTIVWGGTIPMLDAGRLMVSPARPMVIARRQMRLDTPEKGYPREGQFKVSVEANCGTIDELTDYFRERLTQSAEVSASQSFMQGAFARYQDFLRERGVDSFVAHADSDRRLTAAYDDPAAAAYDDPAAAAFKKRRQELHDHPTLGLAEHDFIEDLLFSLGDGTGYAKLARHLAAQLLAYADHKDQAESPADEPVIIAG